MLQPTVRTLSSKGQIVIPASFRRFLGAEPKMKILIWPKPKERKVVLEPLGKDPIEVGFGLLKDWKKSAREIMREIRAEERKYEERKFRKLGFG